MNRGLLIGFCEETGCEYLIDQPMKKYTTFKIGGNADIMLLARNEPQLSALLRRFYEYGIPFHIIGRGANVLVPDTGLRNPVIYFGHNLSRMEIDGNEIHAEAGAPLSRLCGFAMEHSLSGLEFAYGIPGTVGGAVRMNAGAYGGEMKDVIKSVASVDRHGAQRLRGENELEMSYRRSVFCENGECIYSAVFVLEPGEKSEIKARMDHFYDRRREKQPLDYPSAGSAFKRPPGNYASALIDAAGLKGLTVGGAQVSEKHAGFIVNKGGATCVDVIGLMRLVTERVFEHSGVTLEPEVELLKEEV